MADAYVNWKGWKEVNFGHYTSEEALYYAAELRKSGIDSLLGLRIGEIGFGNGSFAGWIRHEGGQWVGSELISLLQERALYAGFDVAGAHDSLANGLGHDAFDLIVAFDVLEHIDIAGIQKFLVDSKSALKPGGAIIFRVPSGDSPFSGAIFSGDLSHRTLLGSSAVWQIAEHAGLKVHQIRCPVLPFFGLGLFRAVRRWLTHIVQKLVFSFIRYFLISNSRAVVSPNMIVVLLKKDPHS